MVRTKAQGMVRVKEEVGVDISAPGTSQYDELRSELITALIMSATAFKEASMMFTCNRSLTQHEMLHVIQVLKTFEVKTSQENLEYGQVQKYKELMSHKKILLDMRLYYFNKMNELRVRFAPLLAQFNERYEEMSSQCEKVKVMRNQLKDFQKHMEEPHKMHETKGIEYLKELIKVTAILEYRSFLGM